MDMNKIFLAVIVFGIFLFCLGFVQDKIAYIIKLAFRGGVGMVLIFLLNAIFAVVQFPLYLGVNFYSICTISFLGFPGIALLYGIIATRNL